MSAYKKIFEDKVPQNIEDVFNMIREEEIPTQRLKNATLTALFDACFFHHWIEIDALEGLRVTIRFLTEKIANEKLWAYDTRVREAVKVEKILREVRCSLKEYIDFHNEE